MSLGKCESGWSESLKRILQPTIQHSAALSPSKNTNLRSSKQPLGVLWKAALTSNIFEDLSSGINSGRRILRLEYFGLQSIALFEYPGGADGAPGNTESLLDLGAVFGDLDSPEDESISVDQLISDIVSAKLIYIPSYSCTSFMTGQLVHAYLFSPESHPKPVQNGFVIHPGTTSETPTHMPSLRSSRGRHTNPFHSPCMKHEYENDDNPNLADTDTSISTVGFDSPGPCTPPNRSLERRRLLADIGNSSRASALVDPFMSPVFKVSDRTISYIGNSPQTSSPVDPFKSPVSFSTIPNLSQSGSLVLLRPSRSHYKENVFLLGE